MSGGIVVTGCGMVTPLGFNTRFTWDALLEGINPFKPLQGKEWKNFEAPRAAQALEAWIPHTLIRRDRSLQLAALAAEEAYHQTELVKITDDRIGTTFSSGEGAAAIVLEREESAKKRKAPIQVRLSGWALGADAYHPFEMEPKGQAIVTVIRKALKKAKLHSWDIGYINAHGTATQLNDRVESQAIHKVFGDKKAWVSSTKGATGHLLGAAGSVEAVLSVIALKEGVLPETRNLNFPDPQCRVRHVETGGVKQRVKHVLSLSYGFGGQLGAVIFSKL